MTTHNPHPDASLTLRECFERYSKPDTLILSKGTQQHYAVTLNSWEFHTENPPVGEITNVMLASYRAKLIESGLAPATVNQRIRYLRCLLRRLGPQDAGNPYGENVLTRVPGCRLLKVPKKWPRIATPDELSAMYWSAGTLREWPGPDAWPWRSFLVVAANTGMRKGDVAALTRQCVDWEERLIRFIAQKTGKAQCVPINEVTALHLQVIFRGDDEPFAWVNRKQAFSHAWAALQETAGIEPPFNPHTLRKTCATGLSAFGVDVAQHILGHSVNNGATDFYLNPSDRIRHAIDHLPQPPAFAEILECTDIVRESIAAKQQTKRKDWTFSIGHACYRGHEFAVPPTLLACLQLLISAAGPVTWRDFARVVWWSSSKVSRKTVRSTLFQLRELLRRELRIPREFNPLTNAEDGQGWTLTLPSTSEESDAA